MRHLVIFAKVRYLRCMITCQAASLMPCCRLADILLLVHRLIAWAYLLIILTTIMSIVYFLNPVWSFLIFICGSHNLGMLI